VQPRSGRGRPRRPPAAGDRQRRPPGRPPVAVRAGRGTL